MNPPFDVAQAHRWFAIEWNNATWDALEAESLDATQQADALHRAHASVAHWREAGNDVNWFRGLCMVSTTEAALGAAGSAIRFALSAETLAAKLGGELADWDLAFLAEAHSRAAAAAWEEEQARTQVDTERAAALLSEARQQRERARQLGEAIAEEEDRKMFQQWFERGASIAAFQS